MSSFWLPPSWGACEGELGDCRADSMLAPCPQLQASGPLPFTFCPGNEAGCLDTFGRQLLHMGCGQRVCVFVSSRTPAPHRSPVLCVSKTVSIAEYPPQYWTLTDFLSTYTRSVLGFVCFYLGSSGRCAQLSSLDLLTGVCQLSQAEIITGQYCVYQPCSTEQHGSPQLGNRLEARLVRNLNKCVYPIT